MKLEHFVLLIFGDGSKKTRVGGDRVLRWEALCVLTFRQITVCVGFAAFQYSTFRIRGVWVYTGILMTSRYR